MKKPKGKCSNLKCKKMAVIDFRFNVWTGKSGGVLTGKFCGNHIMSAFNQDLKPILMNIVSEYKLKDLK